MDNDEVQSWSVTKAWQTIYIDWHYSEVGVLSPVIDPLAVSRNLVAAGLN